MGIFDFFQKPSVSTSVDVIQKQALGLDIKQEEHELVASLEADLTQYVYERNLMRVGISGAGVALFWSENIYGKNLQELSSSLQERYTSYFSSLPGAEPDYAASTKRYIQKNYLLEDPQVIAARLMNNLLGPRARSIDPLKLAPAVEIVRLLMKEVLTTVGNETKRLTK
jgi:hypothetical protein